MSTAAFTLESAKLALPPPLALSATLSQALQQRRTMRAFATRELPLPVLSTLLWSAFGINRPDDGGRTAPSAHNWQEMLDYAVLPEGAYCYEPHAHELLLTRADDLRATTGMQEFVAEAPLNLVYVADFARMPDARGDERHFFAGADAGFIAQNVYLACAALGLATVVRGLVDRQRLAAALGLSPAQRVSLAQSVGYPALVTAEA